MQGFRGDGRSTWPTASWLCPSHQVANTSGGSGGALRERWAGLSLERRRAIIAAVLDRVVVAWADAPIPRASSSSGATKLAATLGRSSRTFGPLDGEGSRAWLAAPQPTVVQGLVREASASRHCVRPAKLLEEFLELRL